MLSKTFDFKIIIVLFFPISLILGSALVNFVLVTTSVFFLYISYKNKINNFKLLWVNFFLLFVVFIVLTSFFSENVFSAFKSSLSQTRFILFALFIYFLDLKKNFHLLKNILIVSLLFVCLDVNIQFFSGYDLFGFPAEGYKDLQYERFAHWYDPNVSVGRLSGPFGSELIPGAFISSLSTPLIFYYFKNYKFSNFTKNIFNFLLVILFLEATLITGERLSSLLILSSIMSSLLICLDYKKSFIIILLGSILIYFISTTENNFLKKRWIDAFNIFLNIEKSSYGRIYSSSINVWSENKVIGTGLKNYRIKCQKILKEEPYLQFHPTITLSPHPYCSPTHPHNLYLELLTETGITGFIIFFSFYLSLLIYLFKNSLKKSNDIFLYFGFGSLFYLIFKLLPLPAGSIFSTWNASIFWFHIGLSTCFLCKKIEIINK